VVGGGGGEKKEGKGRKKGSGGWARTNKVVTRLGGGSKGTGEEGGRVEEGG